MLNTLVHRMEMFQSTHSLRSATFHNSRDIKAHEVSIHALLAECDITPILERNWFKSFNPRTPCGVRLRADVDSHVEPRFQSTHSLRSATVWGGSNGNPILCFNPRTPCGVRHDAGQATPGCICFVSIHALLAECDCMATVGQFTGASFNPRTPCGVRRVQLPEVVSKARVSIHALLAECDDCFRFPGGGDGGFNPRTPCGVRLGQSGNRVSGFRWFQSTHSLRSATLSDYLTAIIPQVSIHALLAECDKTVKR